MDPSAGDIAKFKNLVYDRYHLSFGRGREDQLRRWLMQRVEEGGYPSLSEYYRVLCTSDQEFERLIALITTKETYFFRMPGQFEALRETALPEIIDREGKKAMQALSRGEQYRMRLRAWSAGCATGQEAYSLSMQILDAIRYARAWELRVLGTDINAEALETAKAGRYDRMRLGAMPAHFIEKYVELFSAEMIAVTEAVREITEFQALNLRNLSERESFMGYFDIIFCRNVMIYFDLPAQQSLVSSLADCLRPGGYLFTGEGEVLHLYKHSFEIIEQKDCMVYRKREEREGCR